MQVQTPNTQIVVHRFEDAAVIQEVRGLRSDPFSDRFKSGYVIHGSQGIIAEGAVFDPEGNLVEKLSGRGDNHFANFLAAVRSRRPQELNADIEEGHVSTALCHLGNISYRLGETSSPEEIRGRWVDELAVPEAVETLDKLLAHLRDNGVDPAATPLTSGPLLRIDSPGECFVGHPAADSLLGRAYRPPFELPGEREI